MTFDAEQFKENLTARLRRQYGKDISQANKHDLFDAVSASALEIIMPNWMETRKEYEAALLFECRIPHGTCSFKQPHQLRNHGSG